MRLLLTVGSAAAVVWAVNQSADPSALAPLTNVGREAAKVVAQRLSAAEAAEPAAPEAPRQATSGPSGSDTHTPGDSMADHAPSTDVPPERVPAADGSVDKPPPPNPPALPAQHEPQAEPGTQLVATAETTAMRLSRDDTERIRCRLDRVMELAVGRGQ